MRAPAHLALASAVVVLGCAIDARAEPALLDTRPLSASPDSPVAMIGTRRQVRTKVGVVLPLYGGGFEPGLFLRLPGFIELHNVRGGVIPNQLWRGRLAIEGGFTWEDLFGQLFFRLALALEHESDHGSESPFRGYVHLNSLSLRGETVLDLGNGLSLFASLTNRLHVHTCTISPVTCSISGGDRGARAYEIAIDAVLDQKLGNARSPVGFHLFGSLHGDMILPTPGRVIAERRAVLDVGIALATARRGTFQLYGTTFAGTDVGFLRGQRELVELGMGFRWSP